MTDFRETEAIVIDVIEGRRSFIEGLRAVVTYQEKWNENLCRYWLGRGFRSSEMSSITSVPAVPTDVFKHIKLMSTELEATHIFRTSGTTHGIRGSHHRYSTRAYDIGARLQFSRYVPGSKGTYRCVHLVQDPSEVPDSSLSHMVGDLSEYIGVGEPRYCLTSEGLQSRELYAALSLDRHKPIFMVGTGFVFARLIEQNVQCNLPAGSVVVDTGGFKGSRWSMDLPMYRSSLRSIFGGNATYLSEYSMTELSSQGYAPLSTGQTPQIFEFPHWCAVHACNPHTLEALPDGQKGILRFTDLANIETCVAIQTEDLGYVNGSQITLLGRDKDAIPRGCSLAAEEILS